MDQDPTAWAPAPGSAWVRAQQPGASRNGTWEPVLTTGEFGAIRSAGFEVAGRVSGADVYSLAVVNAGQCPRRHPLWARRCGTFPTEVSSLGFPNASFAPLVAVLYNARRAAIGRMLEKGRALGGHGVIGVQSESLDDPVWGPGFAATGTVVRAPGVLPPQYLFTAQLSGQDFARLVTRGWIPVGLVLGIAIGVRHTAGASVERGAWAQEPGDPTRFYAGNMEHVGITHLVNVTRQEARRELARHAQRLGADGVVLAGQDLNLFHLECPSYEGGRDYCAEVISIGTAITRFAETVHAAGGPPLAVMSVDPQRRQAARANPFLRARLLDRAWTGFPASPRECGPSPPGRPGSLPAGRPAVARGAVATGSPPAVGRGVPGESGDAAGLGTGGWWRARGTTRAVGVPGGRPRPHLEAVPDRPGPRHHCPPS